LKQKNNNTDYSYIKSKKQAGSICLFFLCPFFKSFNPNSKTLLRDFVSIVAKKRQQYRQNQFISI